MTEEIVVTNTMWKSTGSPTVNMGESIIPLRSDLKPIGKKKGRTTWRIRKYSISTDQSIFTRILLKFC